MKVLLFDTTQAYLTPGGKQVHAQKLYENLPKVGVDVEYARWWDPSQDFDVIHCLGYSASHLPAQVKSLGKKIVLTQIMDGFSSLSKTKKFFYLLEKKAIQNLPKSIQGKFSWTTLNKYDSLVYINQHDKNMAMNFYSLNESKVHVIPHASDPLDDVTFEASPISLPNKYLVSVGSIIPRKQPVMLAKLAKRAKVPVVFIGPGSESEEYFQRFKSLIDNEYVFYLGFVDKLKKARVCHFSSGFALLSLAESGCIAVHEAASIGLPLFLSDLAWAKGYSAPKALDYCSFKNTKLAVGQLKNFFSQAKKNNFQSFKIHTWEEVANMYKNVYQSVL